MKKLSLGLIGGITLSVSGCATVFSGTNQKINVKVVNTHREILTDIRCVAVNGRGGYSTLPTNPGIIKVSKRGGVVINCEKEGYRQLNTAVGDSFDKVTLINVLFWPGFIVDAATGSYRKYPSHYLITMEKINHSSKHKHTYKHTHQHKRK